MDSIWGNNLIIGVQGAHNHDYIEHFDLRRMAIDLGIEAGSVCVVSNLISFERGPASTARPI